jgi:4-hydroxy-tetrahydrodipicolinate reductase
MSKSITAISIGIGAMGTLAVRYMTDHGVKIVGAVDHDPEKLGIDIGEKAGIGKLGVKTEAGLEDVLKRTKADIAVIMTQTSVPDVYPYLKLCAENGINVVTISEDWYWPWRTRPDMADEIDALAKKNGVTILATGIQDVHWSNLAVILSSSCHNLKAIRGLNIAFLDELGEEVAKESFAGFALEEFEAVMAQEKDLRAMAYTEVLYCIAYEMRLTVSKEIPSRKPIFAKEDGYLSSIDLHYKKGDIIGMNDKCVLETEEGVEISGDWYLKPSETGETAINRWIVEGEPTLDLVTADMHGECTTSICAVNRIPDVLNSKPGFRTVADMPKPVYRSKPFEDYIK